MFNVCFIPSFLTPLEATDPSSVPLGILTLSAILHKEHISNTVVDGNRCFRVQTSFEFDRELDCVVNEIVRCRPNIVGFSAMCSSMPVSVMVARRVKALIPDVTILFGGPQPSVVAESLMASFDFIDAVYVGEADEQIGELTRCLIKGESVSHVPGLVYRDGGKIIRSPNANLLSDLDQTEYPQLNLLQQRWGNELAIEAGRGCPFPCTFCSTSHFWKRRFRLKSETRIIQEMDFFNKEYGIDCFHLMHDLFTVNKEKVRNFCLALLGSARPYKWSCSSRIDTIDPELIQLMSRAGCIQIYFGLETGSQQLQKLIRKNLDLACLHEIAQEVSKAGVKAVYSFVAGFLEEDVEDIEHTLKTVRDLTRYKDIDVQCHLLVPLPGTPIFPQQGEGLIFDPTWTDATLPIMNDEMMSLILEHPGLFSSYYRFPEANIPENWLRRVPALVRVIRSLPGLVDETRKHLEFKTYFKIIQDWATDSVGQLPLTSEALLIHLLRKLSQRLSDLPEARSLCVRLAAAFLGSKQTHKDFQWIEEDGLIVKADCVIIRPPGGECEPILIVKQPNGTIRALKHPQYQNRLAAVSQ